MIRAKTEKTELVIDLTGPQGNAYSLLAQAKLLAIHLELDFDKISTEMMAGDYENLLQVFDANFGDYVVLER
jgi:hypothetical protein